MRRFVSLAILLFVAVPFGVSISGCSKKVVAVFCNGQNSGVTVGQVTTLDLEPRLTGISLNQGEIGRVSSPTARDCKGDSAGLSSIIYSSSNLTLADIDPSSGSLCAGTWNRQTGGGIPDYTVCNPATTSGTALLTASSDGVVSNAIPIYIHPIVTSIVLGPASTNCATDPASNCTFDATQTNGCGPVTPVTGYDGNACVSQGLTSQLVARTYKNNAVNPASNISCLVGPLVFSAINPSVVTIDANGLATAAQPGSSTINANTSQSSSTAGFFSTCPPTSILLTVPPLTDVPKAPVTVNQNTAQTLIATVKDKNNVLLTNIDLEYISNNTTTVPSSGSVITPAYPGAAAITAICQPPKCNTAPLNEIGLYGNGTTVTSNPVQINATGTNFSTVLYVASTSSQYLAPFDFTLTTQPSPVRLPYNPNSMVISQDQSTIYMGTINEIMTFSTLTNTLIKQDTSLSGYVISVSPDNNTVIVTDKARKLTYLYLASGGIASEYGGVATRAQWSPDSETVYITTDDGRMLVYSNFTGWSAVPLSNVATDVAVTVPSAGVYLAEGSVQSSTNPGPITARTDCPATVISGTGLNQTTTNTFYPQADTTSAFADRLAATTDGVHILGASSTGFVDLVTNQKSGGCPVAFTSTPGAPIPFTGLTIASSKTGGTGVVNVLPTTDSAFAFVTYNGTGGVVPMYVPATKSLTNIKLVTETGISAAPVAPISGTISTDNKTVFVGTSGDNLVHLLTRGAGGFSDSQKFVNPALPNLNGNPASPPDLIVQRPRKTNS